jgi:hypothetical protein
MALPSYWATQNPQTRHGGGKPLSNNMDLNEFLNHLETKLGQRWTKPERRRLWDETPGPYRWFVTRMRATCDPVKQRDWINHIRQECTAAAIKRLEY